MRKIKILLFIFISLFSEYIFSAENKEDFSYESLLSRDEIKARQFLNSFPQFDGRGVVIAVLDTGVDMGVEGLKETPSGEVKVIEARDFSGQGDVSLKEGFIEEKEGKKILRGKEGWVEGVDKLKIKPFDNKYFLGFLDEERFRRSFVKDINGNGGQRDIFAVVAFKINEDDWVSIVDTNADRNIDDEDIIKSYDKDHKGWSFRGFDPSREIPRFLCALTIDGENKKVNFHIPDGSHGTHVAGIAGGFKINGIEGFNGIAPGAKILSLKIGDNTLSGGSTTTESMKKALEFVSQYAEKENVFVVINMSYGIGSEIEGKSDIDIFVNEIIRKNIKIAIVTSAGNQGPGISTLGTPASASFVLAVGASLTSQSSEVFIGGVNKKTLIFPWSARGGELPKPDLVAPGIAFSTVPLWESHNVFRGTSMASPQVAGAMALLLSASVQSGLKNKITGAMIMKSIKLSARELQEYSYLDQGWGILSVPLSFEILKKLAGKKGEDIIVDYSIETYVPTLKGKKGSASFWRSGGYFPIHPQYQEFKIKPIFYENAGAKEKKDFIRILKIEPLSSWIEVDKKNAYIKGDSDLFLKVYYKKEKLNENKIWTGKILAYSEKKERSFIEFVLLNTIIKPHLFGRENGYSKSFNGISLNAGEIKRFFITTPPGASSVIIEASPHKNKYSEVFVFVYDNQGRKIFEKPLIVSSEVGRSVQEILSGEKLLRGTFELVLYAGVTQKDFSIVDLSITFSGIFPKKIPSFNLEAGKYPECDVEIENVYDIPFTGIARGEINGYEGDYIKEIKGDYFKETFFLNENFDGVNFFLSFDEETYNRFTDVAVNVYDERGDVIYIGGFLNKNLEFYIKNPSEGLKATKSYTLEIKAGLTHKDEKPYTLNIRKTLKLKSPVKIKGLMGEGERFSIYPFTSEKIRIIADGIPPLKPDGFYGSGELRMIDEKEKKIISIIPVRF